MTRPIHLCRSWLFVGGADEAELAAAPQSGADAAIFELEDFTPPELRPAARAAAPRILAAWRAAGLVPAVRINPFWDGGREDLAAVMKGAPSVVMAPKIRGPEDVRALAAATAEEEAANGLPAGSTRLAPNCESAEAVFETRAIARADSRVVACLMASEDLAADLGAPRTRDSGELAFARAAFHAGCVAAGVLSIDCPYTFADEDGLRAHCAQAVALGYKAKSLAIARHAPLVNAALTPSGAALEAARRLVGAARDAQAQGAARALIDGRLVETPALRNAEALIARAEALAAVEAAEA